MLVASHERVAVGLAMAQLDAEASEIVLYTLYVHPQWQRQGVGSALLQAAVAGFPDAKAIRLEVLKENAAAIRWYNARGFAIYGETKNATNTPNVAALYMDKNLEGTSDPSARQG
jgi:ribosomal protein S18 acetylase RimI-like enzyme